MFAFWGGAGSLHMTWLPCLIAFKALLLQSVAGSRRQCFGWCTEVIVTVFRRRVTKLLALAAPRLLVLRVTDFFVLASHCGQRLEL